MYLFSYVCELSTQNIELSLLTKKKNYIKKKHYLKKNKKYKTIKKHY
jgi:hypothetical protein